MMKNVTRTFNMKVIPEEKGTPDLVYKNIKSKTENVKRMIEEFVAFRGEGYDFAYSDDGVDVLSRTSDEEVTAKALNLVQKEQRINCGKVISKDANEELIKALQDFYTQQVPNKCGENGSGNSSTISNDFFNMIFTDQKRSPFYLTFKSKGNQKYLVKLSSKETDELRDELDIFYDDKTEECYRIVNPSEGLKGKEATDDKKKYELLLSKNFVRNVIHFKLYLLPTHIKGITEASCSTEVDGKFEKKVSKFLKESYMCFLRNLSNFEANQNNVIKNRNNLISLIAIENKKLKDNYPNELSKLEEFECDAIKLYSRTNQLVRTHLYDDKLFTHCESVFKRWGLKKCATLDDRKDALEDYLFESNVNFQPTVDFLQWLCEAEYNICKKDSGKAVFTFLKRNELVNTLEKFKENSTLRIPDPVTHPIWLEFDLGANLEKYSLDYTIPGEIKKYNKNGVQLLDDSKEEPASVIKSGGKGIALKVPLLDEGVKKYYSFTLRETKQFKVLGFEIIYKEKKIIKDIIVTFENMGHIRKGKLKTSRLRLDEDVLKKTFLSGKKPNRYKGEVYFDLVLEIFTPDNSEYNDTISYFNFSCEKIPEYKGKDKRKLIPKPGLKILSLDSGLRKNAYSICELAIGSGDEEPSDSFVVKELGGVKETLKDLYLKEVCSGAIILDGEGNLLDSEMRVRIAVNDKIYILERCQRALRRLKHLYMSSKEEYYTKDVEYIIDSFKAVYEDRDSNPAFALENFNITSVLESRESYIKFKTFCIKLYDILRQSYEQRYLKFINNMSYKLYGKQSRKNVEQVKASSELKKFCGGESIFHIELKDRIHRLKRNHSLVGKKRKELKKGTDKKLLEHKNEVLNNRILKLVNKIIKLALEQGCHLILIENLQAYLFSQSRSKRENSRLAVWSHRGIAEKLMEKAALEGIRVIEVDARYSSQYLAQNCAPGKRARILPDTWFNNDGITDYAAKILSYKVTKKEIKEAAKRLEYTLPLSPEKRLEIIKAELNKTLKPGSMVTIDGGESFVSKLNGKYIIEDADVNAARNLIRRYILRHREIFMIDCAPSKKKDGIIIPSSKGERANGALYFNYDGKNKIGLKKVVDKTGEHYEYGGEHIEVVKDEKDELLEGLKSSKCIEGLKKRMEKYSKSERNSFRLMRDPSGEFFSSKHYIHSKVMFNKLEYKINKFLEN